MKHRIDNKFSNTSNFKRLFSGFVFFRIQLPNFGFAHNRKLESESERVGTDPDVGGVAAFVAL